MIDGSMHATKGTIGGWTISSDKLSSNYVQLKSTGIYFGALSEGTIIRNTQNRQYVRIEDPYWNEYHEGQLIVRGEHNFSFSYDDADTARHIFCTFSNGVVSNAWTEFGGASY